MKITELRESFASWPAKYPVDQAAEILTLLRDPTPITEAGLRELGFGYDRHNDEWLLGEFTYDLDIGRVIFATGSVEVKSMGQLRMLLLGVGE